MNALYYTFGMLQNYSATLLTKQQVAPNVYRLEFRLRKPKILTFAAGQYLLLVIPGGYRQYSISSSPRQQCVLETVVDVTPMGNGSRYLLGLNINDPVQFRAPLGVFALQKNQRRQIFLATGVGIAPVSAMLYELIESQYPNQILLLWGLRNFESIYFQSRLKKWQQQNQAFKYVYCLSREEIKKPHFFYGHIQDMVKTLKSPIDSDFYLCGYQPTIDSLKEFLIGTIGVNSCQIHYERFA